ncbi:hypothetical protein HN51_018703, partial [Arachis hypogaea]
MFQFDCLLPQSFKMHHIHEIPHRVVFTDSGSNYMDKLPAFFCMLAMPLRGIRVSLVSRCGNFIPCRIAWIADDEAYLTRGWFEFARILNVDIYD